MGIDRVFFLWSVRKRDQPKNGAQFDELTVTQQECSNRRASTIIVKMDRTYLWYSEEAILLLHIRPRAQALK